MLASCWMVLLDGIVIVIVIAIIIIVCPLPRAGPASTAAFVGVSPRPSDSSLPSCRAIAVCELQAARTLPSLQLVGSD